jgi:hypothetical protein
VHRPWNPWGLCRLSILKCTALGTLGFFARRTSTFTRAILKCTALGTLGAFAIFAVFGFAILKCTALGTLGAFAIFAVDYM